VGHGSVRLADARRYQQASGSEESTGFSFQPSSVNTLLVMIILYSGSCIFSPSGPGADMAVDERRADVRAVGMAAADERWNGWINGELLACEKLVAGAEPAGLAALATQGLAICCKLVPSPPDQLLGVIRVGEHDWSRGHLAFDAVRERTLDAERRADAVDARLSSLLYVAENAARVIYNASCPPDPFDADSAAWLLKTMSRMASHLPPQDAELFHRSLIDLFVQFLPAVRGPG
jgi:hypothetical protein